MRTRTDTPISLWEAVGIPADTKAGDEAGEASLGGGELMRTGDAKHPHGREQTPIAKCSRALPASVLREAAYTDSGESSSFRPMLFGAHCSGGIKKALDN